MVVHTKLDRGAIERDDRYYQGRMENPQTTNLYTYVLNNPLKPVDPTGHVATAPEDASFRTRLDWAQFESDNDALVAEAATLTEQERSESTTHSQQGASGEQQQPSSQLTTYLIIVEEPGSGIHNQGSNFIRAGANPGGRT